MRHASASHRRRARQIAPRLQPWIFEGPPPGSGERLLRVVLALLLTLGVLLLPASDRHGAALAWTLPGRNQPGGAGPAGRDGPGGGFTGGSMQEVAPPSAVLQISDALAHRQPRITIVEPADGAILDDGPWSLRLRVDDWPLVQAGSLGPGPHLLVQLDDAPPIRLFETSLTLPPLAPGSHRLTVMAARPWGEVVKRPGSFQQIRLHRVTPNPLGLPAPGTPQLLVTAPLDASPDEPLLLDWLLIDTPLQHLRADDARWRLRLTINGDSVLVDQPTPLWLKGWKQGANALLLELVDGRGEPLNPPFNSQVKEIRLDHEAARPAWRNGPLSDDDLSRLLGVAPAEAEPTPSRQAAPEAPAAAAPQAGLAPLTQASEGATDPDRREAPDRATGGEVHAPMQDSANREQAATAPSAAAHPPATPSPPISDSPARSAQEPQDLPAPQRLVAPEDGIGADAAASGQEPATGPETITENTAAADPASERSLTTPQAGREEDGLPPAATMPVRLDQEAGTAAADPAPPAADGAWPAAGDSREPRADAGRADAPPAAGEALQPSAAASPPRPAARDEVNPDGTLIRPRRPGPLQSMLERLQP